MTQPDELLPCPEIVIDEIGGQCPVQAEGTIDGKPFYFRARGGHWSMSIGGDNVIGDPEWYFSAPYPDPHPSEMEIYDKQPQDGGVVVDHMEMEFAAGWMEESAARSFIHTAAVLYANTRPTPRIDDQVDVEAFKREVWGRWVTLRRDPSMGEYRNEAEKAALFWGIDLLTAHYNLTRKD